MDNSQLALLVASLSVGLSLATLVWTIYRDTRKPTLRVDVTTARLLFQESAKDGLRSEDALVVVATNSGPGPIVVREFVVRHRSWVDRLLRRRSGVSILNERPADPSFTSLPKQLAFGESFEFRLPMERNFLSGGTTPDVGVEDGFGRMHWASRRRVARATAHVRGADPVE